jgi:N12 class adenine-specific DNA methylase
MALNVEKLRAKAGKKPVGKPVGKEVAAQYYARQEAAKGINTAQTGNSAVGTGNAAGTGTASVPASVPASAPVDEVSSARAYLDSLAVQLNTDASNSNASQSPARISGDLRGVAKEGLSGAFGKDLPSGAPAVRPAMQKSVEEYKAANEAAEVLAASGKLSDKDIGTLNKAYNTAVSDAIAYDAAVARQAPTDFANKVDKLQSKPVSGVRHDIYTAARPMEAIGGADGAKMSYDEIRAANEDFNKRYTAMYKDYLSGRVTAADMAALGKDKAKLDKDNNAFLASAQDSFARAVNKAYVKYVPRVDRMEVKQQIVPRGYDGTKADAAEADLQSRYMDVYAKFLRGEATEKELAELKGKALAVKAQNEAFWETTDGIIEYGKRLRANRETLKKDYETAKKAEVEAQNAYRDARTNAIKAGNGTLTVGDLTQMEEAKAARKAAEAAYEAANKAVNLNDLQHEYAVKYKQAYETALAMNNGSPIMQKGFGYTPKDIDEIDGILKKWQRDHTTYRRDNTDTKSKYDLLRVYGNSEEKQIFAFVLEKDGKDAAKEYLDFIRPLMDIRYAAKTANDYSKANFFGKMGLGFTTQAAGGLSDFSAGLTGVGKALIGDTSYTFPTTAQSVASGVREAESGAVAGAAMDIIRSTANMAPSIAVGAALSAAGMPGAALIQSLSFGGSAGGNAYIQSINDGKGYGEAVLYGAVVGTSEVCLERVLGGIEGLGGKGVSRFMETKAGKAVQARLSSFLSKFGTTAKGRTALEVFNATGRFLSNNTAEGLEEFTQDMLDPIFRNVIFGEDNAVFTQENFDNAMYSFCVGFWNAGLLNATSEISRFKTVNRIINGKGTMQDVTDALESPEMRRDLERIFTRTFKMAEDGKFTFSSNELVNAVFLEMWQKGVKQGTAHADDIRAEAGDAADVAQSGIELAEAVNKAADSVADRVGEDIRQSQRVVDADVTADSDIRTEQAAAEPVRENAEQERDRAVSTAGAAENAEATAQSEVPTASAAESTGDVGALSAESTASDTSKIEQIKQKAISPKEALDNSSPFADKSYSEIDKKSSRAAEALSGALGVNIKIFSDTAGIGNFYDSASDTLYIDGDGDLPVSYQLRRGLMTMLASSDSAGFAKLRDFLVGKYIEMFGKDAYTEYAEKKKNVFAEDGLSLDDIGVGNELCADLGVFMLSDADTAKAIAKELRTPEAKKLLHALEMLSKTEEVNFDFLPTSVEALDTADMKTAEKMVLDMFFRDGVGKDRKNSYVVAESTSGTDAAKGIFDETTATKRNPATKEEIDSYIDYSLEYASVTKEKGNVTFPKQREAIDYGEASERMVDDLKNDVDVTGKRHVLRDNDIRHIVNSHGENTNEKYPITASDLKQIPDIVENYDDVLFVPHPNGNKGIYYVKQHNGITYYLEAIAQNDALIGKQMIKVPTGTVPDIRGLSEAINKKWSAYSRQMNKIPRMYVQDASHTAPFVNSIPENNGGNNAENVNNLQNKADSAAVKEEKANAAAESVPKAVGKTDAQAKQEAETETEPKAKTEVKTKIQTEGDPEENPGAKSDYVFADLPEHTVEEGKHTKTGDTIYVLKLKDRVSTDDYKAINTEVKAKGGYYSRYAKGFIVPKEIFDAYNAFAEGQKAVDNSGDVGYNEVGNVIDVKNGKEGTEDVQGRGILDGESGHDGGRLRRETAGSDDGSGDSQDVSEARKNGGRVLQGDSLDQASGRDGGNDGEGANGSDVRGSDHGEVKESSSARVRKGDLGRADSGHVRLVSEQPLTEESGADTEAASDVSSAGKKAVDTATPEEKKAVKPEDGEKAGAQEAGNTESKEADAEKVEKSSAKKVSEKKEPEKASENTPEEVDTEATAILKKRPSNKENFSISDEFAATLDSTPPNAIDNIAAIRLLKRIEEEGRPATTEEKEILAKYKGWGGIDLRNLNYEARRDLDSLFSYEQRVAMQNSSLTAYFTPTKVIDAMYTGLMRMGFKGGNILESSMGIGNFFGRMPKAISAKSSLTGVEMESYTARIAQLLYPGATVINKPFQDVAMRNDAFDLVIGNVPFGTTYLSYGKKKYLLHNYFILSSLDKVREGGIVAVLTSAGTLDSYGIDARKAIMDKADVVACYKLPERVFSRNANTDVQTDLLILRKRAAGAKPTGDSILNVVTTDDGLRINEYFAKHPENVLGTLAKGTNAWGEITTVKGETDFYERLTAAMNRLPSGLFTGKTTLAPIESIVSVSTKPRFFDRNGAIYEDSGEGKAIKVDEKKVGVVSDYIAVRDAYKEMLDAYGKNLPEADIKPLRDKLTSAYDSFVVKHGPISGDGKKKNGAKKSANNTFLEADSDYYLVGGLEKYDEKAKKFEKSALFEKDTLRKKQVEHVDTASDALTISLNESGKVDFKRMHELTGMSEKKLIDELSGEIILTPDGDYVLTDIYLSGNIYEKLDAVKGKKGFEKQQEMLERAIPKPKAASEIDVKLGANYIDAKYIGDFARDVFRTRLEIGKDSAGHWSIEGARASRYGDILTVKYGLPGMNAVQLLEKILNDSEIKVMKTVNEGSQKRSVFDEEKTNVAMQKADDIREAFANWVFKSTERRNDIVDKYNRMYNNFKAVDYEKIAEKLSFDSMDANLKNKLYPHQKRAIARALFGGDVLFAHGVGTGKTFEMIASVMEAKRMGLVNKAAMVVPKNKVSDFKKDIAGAYPNAKVLIVSTQNVKRQSMIGLIGSNDWDIVLLSRETFTKIPVSETLQQNFVLQQLEDVQRELSEAQADRNTARRVINGLKKRSETLENKLKEIDKATKRDENSVDFEKLGIDCICVDEAHNYKSIVTPTRLNIKGLSKTGDSQRANDMLMKLDYMRAIGGKIIFGTGTPITNTVSEIYNMARMVCPSVLEEAGIHSLDEWVNTFGKVESTTEIDIGNNIKSKSTQIIRKFINPNEMIGMFRQFADVVFTEDVVTNLPKAKFIQVEIEGTDVHKKVMETVGSALQNAKNSEKMKVSSQVMAMATAAAADPKMLAGADSVYNPFGEYSAEELEYENSKMNKMCDITFDEYQKSNDIKGTQIIFCDSGAGSGTIYSFNLHKDIKEKLIKRGIPENEIVIVQSQSDEKLEELFRQVNDGEVRVLIGTSAKMAEGLNVQKRVVAIHHPTVTFTPADLEQGNARGVRQGNMNSEVRIYNYVQGDTFDAYKWQAQARKGEMIKRALRGEAVSELEDVGDDIDPADAMAVASGNPLVKEKIDIDKEVVRLKNLQRNYLNEVYSYQDTVSKNPDLISQTKRYIANMERDIGLRDKYGEKDSIVLDGKEYMKQAEANKALTNAVQKAPKDGEYKKLGTYNGFDIMFKGETGGLNYSILLKGANGYAVEYAGSGNNIARFAGALRRLDTALEKEKARLETLISDLELAKKEANKPFEHQSELESALQKQKDITYQYEHFNEKKLETPADKAGPGSDSDIKAYRADRRQPRSWKTKRAASFKKSKAKVKPIPEIVDKIREKFDVPVRTGNMRSRGTLGQYDERQISIRSRFANDLPTLSHELGHYLDAEYGFSNKEAIRKLIHALPEPFKAMYSESVLPGEAFAEYLRKYLTNKDEAAKKHPEFTELFERTLSDGDMQSVNELADDINAYLSSTPEERLQASVLSKEQIAKRDKISKSEAFDNMRRRAKDYFVDDISALEELGELVGIDSVKNGRKSPYALAFLARKAEYTGYHIITNELCDMEGNQVGKSLMERLYPVGNNMDNFNYYLVAKRAVEVLKRNPDLPLMPDPTLNDVGVLQQIVDEYDRRYSEFEKVSEDVYDFLRQVQRLYGQASGVESAEQLNFLEDIYPHYVPLKRALKRSSEKLTGGSKSGYANQNSTIKRFKGSTEEFVAPTDSIIDMVMRVVKVARRNAVGASIADIANKSKGLSNIIERVEPDKTMQSFNLMKQKEELLDKALAGGMVDEEGKFKDLINDIFDDVQMKFIPYVNGGKNIVSFRVNGKTQYFQIGDKRLYDAIANINSNDIEPTLKVLNKIQGIMKYGIVGVNPAYIIGNFAKDIGTAWYSSDEMNFASFAASYVATAKDILLNDPEYKRFLAMGGGHNVRIEWKKYYIKKEMERMVRAGDKKGLQKLWNELSEPFWLGSELFAETHNPFHAAAGTLGVARKTVGKVPEKIGEISEFVESIPRAQEFIRKSKADPVGAMYAADEITTNFQKHGKARWVNSVFMFGNAGIQGFHKAFRHYTKGTKKELAMRWTKLILTGILLEALQAAFNRDDQEEYENLSTYTKNNNYVLSLGDGRFFKVPKPREFAVFSSAIGRSIEYVFGNDEAFYDFADYVFDMFSPPGIPSITDFDNSDGKAFEKVIHGVLSDTVFSGSFDIGFNIDYKGDEIVPSYMDNYKTESDKVYDTTSKVAIAIGKMLNMSPIKVDYLLSNGLGVFGRAAQYLFPSDSSRRDLTFGIKSRLFAQSQYSTDVYDHVYEKAEKAKKAYDAGEEKGYSVETLLEYEDTQMLKTLVSQYRRAIRYSDLTTEEKEQRLTGLQALIRTWDSTPTEADKRSIELFESTGNTDVFYKTFASNIKSTLTGEVKVPQYEDGKIVAVKTMNYTAELSPDEYLMFFNDACRVIDEAKLALLNADELDDEVKAKKVAKNIKDGISKLKKRYLEDFGKPTEESK